MDEEAFCYINSRQIEKLLQKYPLGVHRKFEHYVKQWQVTKWDTNDSNSNSPTPLFTPPISSSLLASSELLTRFSLDEILKRSTHGSMIISYYESNKNLNETCRNLLVDLIIASLFEKKHPMCTALAKQISDMIVGTFTRKYILNEAD
ncbi:uncharacterized protein LOC115034958 [Acyrthosiphon pisum]|uniref:Uncharacterized protein n=1 Tax=Acyrthosiphon pisum TaxID=7029 RepID=A0A8R2NW81_ACYPI|nr:uncharacterized protein LOC115034958 [Acyrthosiphon pisum]